MDISRLVLDGKVKLEQKRGGYEFDVSSKQMLIALKIANLPSGQMKHIKWIKVYPDAECEVLARLIPEDSTEPEEPPPEFKILEFTKEYDDIVTDFRNQFNDPTLARYKSLCIAGDSRIGKSVFAQNLLKNPYIMNSGWNFANYDPRLHDGIVCNDVRDIASKIMDYRTLFQSAGTSTLGESRTNCYSIDVVNTLRRPIVVTLNKEGQFEILKKLDWVRQNAYIIDCEDRKMYVEDEEDEDVKRKREHHEIDVLRWDYGPDAEKVYHQQKRQKLIDMQNGSDYMGDTL